jgi:large subunit ribosomal protein L32e
MVVAINRKRVEKKRTKRFTRFESEDYPHKLRPSWRKPHGIDNRMRRKFKGNKPLVQIGYRNNRNTRYAAKDGLKRFLVTNAADLEILLMNNRAYAGTIAHNISGRKRAVLIKRAAELDVKLTNPKARVTKEEKKKAN